MLSEPLTIVDQHEKDVILKYRQAKAWGNATIEIHVQDGVLVRINSTDKWKPGTSPDRRLRG